MIKTRFPHIEQGVHYATSPKEAFELSYMNLRQQENRVPHDALVQQLPKVPEHHPHVKEWRMRRKTLQRFMHYLSNNHFQTILDIGCGNGWFTAKLAPFAHEVVGMDVGKQELATAARCFPDERITFLCCTDWSLLPASYFDCIVFNASIQYFPFSTQFWNDLFRLLKPGGEIHLLDSPFYSAGEVNAAKKRSEVYFRKQQSEHAADYYFHHTWEELPPKSETHYLPSKWKQFLRIPQSPFPWIIIRMQRF
jgi:ubiquinone/menaquinone biosynthesis C-methylase UbiE